MKEPTSQIVDVRTAEEFAGGHIANAVNMDVTSDDFDSKIQSLDTEKPVMVYCKSGGRSAKAASILKEKGFKNVYDLDGGILGWEDAKKPIEN
jgi:rhodanese-related sulfurtransferase